VVFQLKGYRLPSLPRFVYPELSEELGLDNRGVGNEGRMELVFLKAEGAYLPHNKGDNVEPGRWSICLCCQGQGLEEQWNANPAGAACLGRAEGLLETQHL
jgi:hypothetical protein